ncbi:MAG: efflux RND transporter periplasmic adaptor subunit [Chlorobi bacterium]|nr:efflux RND transporter periplasmic adaptor subunit [Chlorobiota bacterium]
MKTVIQIFKYSFFPRLMPGILGLILWAGCNRTDGEKVRQAPSESRSEMEKEKEEDQIVVITPEQFEANDMALGTVEEREFADFIHTNGIIGVPPANRAAVSPVYGGYVKDVRLLDGDYVRKGQVLFTLRNPEYLEWQQRYLQLKEQTAYLKAEYERQKKLYEEQISSAKTYLKARADYYTAKAEKEALAKKLRMAGIDPASLSEQNIRSVIAVRAPVSGFVSDLDIEKGAYIEPAHMAMEILDPSHKHAEIKVFEKDIHKLKKGQIFEFNLPNQPEKIYTGKIFLIGKKVDPEKRFVNVHGHIDREKEARELLPEMFIDVRIIHNRYRAQALPETALLDEGDVYFVLVKRGERDGNLIFEKVYVKPGKHYRGYVEILEPRFTPQDTILVRGGYFLSGAGEEGGHAH